MATLIELRDVTREYRMGEATVQALRAKPLTRTLNPKSVYTFSETMTPHPSLSEVVMWTRYYYEGK